jgi:hypothetical protein
LRSWPDNEHELAPNLPGRLLGEGSPSFPEGIRLHGNAQPFGGELGQLRDSIHRAARLNAEQTSFGKPFDIEGSRQ